MKEPLLNETSFQRIPIKTATTDTHRTTYYQLLVSVIRSTCVCDREIELMICHGIMILMSSRQSEH